MEGAKKTIYRFFLLGYGKVYSTQAKLEKSLDNARFSALMQFALLLTLNVMAVVFLIDFVYCDFSNGIESVCSENSWVLRIFIASFAGLIILCIKSVSRVYGGEYEADFPEDKRLRKYVDLYPYFVMAFLIFSVGVKSMV